MLKEAILLAGGFGTRLSSIITDVPKPMAPVLGIPFIEYQLRYLKHHGIKRIVFSTGYLSNKISDYFKNNFLGLEIKYAIENEPLGTGGGIRLAIEQCIENEILVLNGDSYFDFDLNHYHALHKNVNSLCSLAVRRVNDASRYGSIVLNELNQITAFREKQENIGEGLINAGVYILNRSFYLNKTKAGERFSIEKDFFEKNILQFNIFGFEMSGYFIDIGIPEDYNKAQHDFKTFKY